MQKNNPMNDIPGFDTFISVEPIQKGWSDDKKYRVVTAGGARAFLRVSDIAEYERKKAEYAMMSRAYYNGVVTPEPLGFGLCNNGLNVYSLSGWLDGADACEALPFMTGAERYAFGRSAGVNLKKIHSLPAPGNAEPWSDYFYNKVRGRVDYYRSHPITSAGGDMIVRFLTDNARLLIGRPQTAMHGDYGLVNLIIMPGGVAGAIDYNAYNKDHGDPWWEFDPVNWGGKPDADYCTGLIDGYFGDAVPDEFFLLHRYYLAYDALAALCETAAGNQGEPDEGPRHLANVLAWFNGMNAVVPVWYRAGV